VVSLENFAERALCYIVSHTIEITKLNLATCILKLFDPHLPHRIIHEIKLAFANVAEAKFNRVEGLDWRGLQFWN
jgi:hypothetical protein